MYNRIINYPKNSSFFIFGPRGTGKTTWVKNEFPGALYLDLLESEKYINLSANPQRIEQFIPKMFREWIIVDEIQRIPELLNEVHRLIENSGYKFILTGSSPRKLRKKGTNLLAGRAIKLNMHPLSAEELKEDFNIEKSLKYGNLPSVYKGGEPEKYLQSYVGTYLEEEIKQEGLTRNMRAFTRFLEAASFSQCSVLNMSEVARESSVERKVVENYFNIIEDLLISQRIPVFKKRAKRQVYNHPKFFLFDTGVYRAVRPSGPLDSPEEIEGSALETLLFQELTAVNENHGLGYDLYFWNTSNRHEVDFVLYGKRGIKAFEIKRTRRLTPDCIKNLKIFLKDYPGSKAYLIYGGTEYLREDKIEILPLEKTFRNLLSILES
ncbi:ATP-binding protein [candidate division WOR-3 bacterium]|nr:ATP-binding protein [candidate division WOR-3 bacterium]